MEPSQVLLMNSSRQPTYTVFDLCNFVGAACVCNIMRRIAPVTYPWRGQLEMFK